MSAQEGNLNWSGVYSSHGIFAPYQGSASLRGEIIGLARVEGNSPNFEVVWSWTIIDAGDKSHVLASGLLRGAIDAEQKRMTLDYVDRIGTTKSPGSSSGGTNFYALKDITKDTEGITEFVAGFDTPKTKGDIRFRRCQPRQTT